MSAPSLGRVPDRLRPSGTAVLAGLLIAAAVPPWGWWPLTLLGLYRNFGYNYEDIFKRVATNAFKVACTQYSASNFFSNRTTIGPLMELHLRSQFSELNLNAKMPGFQLSSVHLPQNFEGSIRETDGLPFGGKIRF